MLAQAPETVANEQGGGGEGVIGSGMGSGMGFNISGSSYNSVAEGWSPTFPEHGFDPSMEGINGQSGVQIHFGSLHNPTACPVIPRKRAKWSSVQVSRGFCFSLFCL